MDFGDKDRFAITIDLNENHGGAWLFGRICYWIAGNIVGNYEEGTSLRDALFQMRYVYGDCGQRTCPALMQLPNEKAFELISGALRRGSSEIYEYLSDDFMPARFDVCIHIDVFDDWEIYLIEDGANAKILYRNLDERKLNAFTLKSRDFDAAAVPAYECLDKLYDAAEADEGGSLSG